ncbi:MAG: ABC transporter substrate-binding protein [Hyphomonadaceae bacterium]|nr:ABC transporter substrate-binding protein [Hyphomonadaceae bacterium]
MARDVAVEVAVRWLVCALALGFASAAEAVPQRVVSLDYCADQFVLALADRDQIAALSRGAQRDDSHYRARARGIRQTRGTLEEVLALRPDLIVRNWGGPWDAQEVYGRFGVPVLQVGDSTDFDAARLDIREAAAAFGQRARGEALVRDLDARLQHLRATAPPHRAAVMYLSAGGAVAGRGTLMDVVITEAGGRNLRSEQNWAVLPVEQLVQTPPALVALGFFDHGRTRMNAWRPTRHAAVTRALAHARTIELPVASVSCETWLAIDAAERIRAALRP